jgi:hypothetical protein
LLIISGTMGAGKTAVLGEASDILVLRQIAHVAVDLDCLGLAHLPSTASNNEVMYGNLRSVSTTMLPSGCNDSWWRARWKIALS